ncbi:MAG: WxL domain-containing protein [Patulibacter sp.]
MTRPHPNKLVPVGAPTVIACLTLFGAASAHGATASATLTGGTLALDTAPNVTFTGVTLDGTNKTTTGTQALTVTDPRGTGVGWKLTATSTLFTTGSVTLPSTATTITAEPSATCLTTCTNPTTSSLTWPYTLPAASTAPTATTFYNAASSTGLGKFTITPTWTLTVPASATAGTYTSTWTISIASGPS